MSAEPDAGPESLLNSAAVLFQAQRYQEAASAYAECIRSYPQCAAGYSGHGRSEGALGNHAAAIEDFDAAIRLEPEDAAASHYYRASSLLALGRDGDAMRDLDRAIELQPDFVEAYCARAKQRIRMGEQQEAVTDCNEAVRRQPDFADAYYQRAIAWLELGRKDLAEKDHNEAVRLRQAPAAQAPPAPRRTNRYLAAAGLVCLILAGAYAYTHWFGQGGKREATENASVLNRGVVPLARSGQFQPITHRVAFVIGNNLYESPKLPRLTTAVADATAVGLELSGAYGFEVKLETNARRADIINQLNTYARDLQADSELLIYYAGHGYYDRKAERAYWLPVDAQPDGDAEWISADDITTHVKRMAARHVLIISDSCYSGMLTRAAQVDLESPASRDAAMRLFEERPSRMVMSSGGNEPVADGGGDGHSIFAAALLKGLDRMGPPRFSVDELFQKYIREKVAGSSAQLPELNPLRDSGHDGGSFVFARTGTPAIH